MNVNTLKKKKGTRYITDNLKTCLDDSDGE